MPPTERARDIDLLRMCFWIFLVQLLFNMLAWGGVLGWTMYQEFRITAQEREHRLLKDYTEGRIDHLPYKPSRPNNGLNKE